MSDKCHTEFVGEYHSMLGNYRLVGEGAGGGNKTLTPRNAAGASFGSELSSAASVTLALPRIKYVVERELAGKGSGRGKVRTESM